MNKPNDNRQVVESWAAMSEDAKKRRIAKAIQKNDMVELRSLLESYTLMFTKSRTDTSPCTLSAYWRGAVRLLDWCKANGCKIHKIGSEEILRFIASMGNLSAKSRQLHMTGCRTLIKALRWVGMDNGNPFVMENGISITIRDPKPIYGKADPYNEDEVSQLLSSANERERCLILLGIDGGLRVAEMCDLKWDGIDIEHNILNFMGKWSKPAKVLATPRLMEAILDMPTSDSERVFGVGRRRLQQIFTKCCKDAGVRPRGLHNLRHTCGTRVARNTKDPFVVKRHLRHNSIVGSELYVHLADDDYRQGIESLNLA